MQRETIGAEPSHPNGPRTFAHSLRDAVGLPPGILDRLRALEDGRHPTLTDVRAALGLHLNLNPFDAARGNWYPPNTTPDDTDLARVIDAMYGSITSPRMIRATIYDSGVHASRDETPIAIREGEHLVIYAIAENHTDGDVDFSVEGRGEGAGISVEARRSASLLLDAGPMPAGKYHLPVLIVADGKPATLDLPIECAPSGAIAVRVLDDDTGATIPARVYLTDDLGAAYPLGANIRRDIHGNAWFHAGSAFEARVSGGTTIKIVRGIEYEAFETDVTVAGDQRVELTARLRRWSHMAADGWYSGDVHVHLHYGGEYLLTPEDASLAQRAEDANFMNMMVANQGSGWVHDQPYFTGAPNELSDGDHILQWGEEYRNDFYGHMCMYGIRELVPPIYSGFRESEHADDMPPNAHAAQHCHSVGGTLSYAHPVFDSIELDRVFNRSRTVEAKELPVDAALGHIDAMDVMSYPGHELQTSALWYRLLNCGHRLAATAGTDTFMNFADMGRFSNPPAGDRVYVRIAGAFTTQSWCEAVRAGRTFVTDGPMLSLSANGHDIGDTIEAKRGDVIHVEAAAGSYAPMDVLELVVNGEVVASGEATDNGRTASLTHDLRIDASCWIAARARGPAHPLVLDDLVFAHTSPIYVTVDSTPISRPDDARYFVDWIDRLIAMAETKGVYHSPADRDSVVGLFREGQNYYRQLAT